MPLLPKLHRKYTKILTYFYAISSSIPIALRFDTRYSPHQPGQSTLKLFLGICILTYLGAFQYYLINLISSYYPLVMSIKALRNNVQTDKERWISYWMIYICTIVFYSPIRLVLGFLPIFELWRLGLYICLFHPSTDLAYKIYQNTFKRMFLKKEIERKEKMEKQKYLEKRLGSNQNSGKKIPG